MTSLKTVTLLQWEIQYCSAPCDQLPHILCIKPYSLLSDRLKDLGLEKFDTVELFAKILLPSAFLLACILQLHYFHKDFLKITDLRNVPGDAFTLGRYCKPTHASLSFETHEDVSNSINGYKNVYLIYLHEYLLVFWHTHTTPNIISNWSIAACLIYHAKNVNHGRFR